MSERQVDHETVAIVCLYVRPIRPPLATAANFAAVARPAGDIDRLLHCAQQRGVLRANAGSAALSAYVVAARRLVSNVSGRANFPYDSTAAYAVVHSADIIYHIRLIKAAFGALTLLVGWQEGHLAVSGGVLAWLSVCSEMQTCIWPS